MNRKLVSLLLAGALAASMLTACGTSGGGSSSQETPAPAGSQVEDAQGSASPKGEGGSSEESNP